MANHNEIKAALKNWASIIKPYKKANTKKAILQMSTSYLPFIGLWVLMYLSLSWSYWITLPLALINAFFLVRIFIIQHDCGHQSFFKSKKINNVVGWASSFFSTIPYDYWARVHSFHHGHTGQLEHRDIGDINFLTVEEFRALPKWRRFFYRLFRHPLVMFIVIPIYYLAIGNRYHGVRISEWKSSHISLHLNNLLLAGLFVGLGFLLGWSNFLMVHLPIVFFFGVIAFWFFYVQHQHETTYMQWNENWDYLLAAIRGATFYKLPKFFHWLTGNIGYHHIHHLSHRIPSYNLPKCAKENPLLQKYVFELTFIDSLKTMFNKLWDEQQQRMISFKEFYEMERMRLA